jgi:hypothetical protein
VRVVSSPERHRVTVPAGTDGSRTAQVRSGVRWAGQVTGNVAIGGIVGLLGVLPAIAIAVAGIALWSSHGNGEGIAAGAVLIAIGVALFLVSLLVIRALSGIFGVALYRFAADGEATGGFTAGDLESAVRTR